MWRAKGFADPNLIQLAESINRWLEEERPAQVQVQYQAYRLGREGQHWGHIHAALVLYVPGKGDAPR